MQVHGEIQLQSCYVVSRCQSEGCAGLLNAPAYMQVSAFVTAAQIKFLLLHDGRSDESIRQFFRDVQEVFLKVMMNPFFSPRAPVKSAAFYQRVRAISRSHFRS